LVRVCDRPLLLDWPGLGRGMVGFRLGDIDARARDIIHGLIERLMQWLEVLKEIAPRVNRL
jgi:hypothetical protein